MGRKEMTRSGKVITGFFSLLFLGKLIQSGYWVFVVMCGGVFLACYVLPVVLMVLWDRHKHKGVY
jgi:hypothetical protein